MLAERGKDGGKPCPYLELVTHSKDTRTKSKAAKLVQSQLTPSQGAKHRPGPQDTEAWEVPS